MFTIASLNVMAQDGFRHGPRHSADPLTPEQVAALQTKRMTLALDLTLLQQEQVQEFHLENARLRKEKMEARKEEQGGKTRKELSAEERYQRESERLDHMIANKEKMKKILTPEQFGKWEKGMHHRKHHERMGDRERPGRR